MKHYYLLRNILLGTAAGTTLTAFPTVAASMDESATARASSAVLSPLHTSLRVPSVSVTNKDATVRSNSAYDRAMRHLQESSSSNQDALDHCSGHTTAMITCLLTQCVGQEPCEQQEEPVTSPEGGERDCETVTSEVCGALDHSCCEPCSDHTKAYLDCFLDFEVSGTCPDASCTATGADSGREVSTNSTTPPVSSDTTTTAKPIKPNATESPGESVTAFATPQSSVPSVAAAGTDNVTVTTSNSGVKANATKGCDTVAADLEACVVLNCAFRNCNDSPLDFVPAKIDDCDATKKEYCASFRKTEACCPQCEDITAKSTTCFLESIAETCPGSECSDKSSKSSVLPPKKRKAHLQEVSVATTWAQEEQQLRSSLASGSSPSFGSSFFLLVFVTMTLAFANA